MSHTRAAGSPPAIEASGLTKMFGRAEKRTTAVDHVDLVVPAGGVYAVLGTNGAGKTTTVRMLATLLRPDAGSARIFGADVVRRATSVRAMIGVTGQYASVDEDLTATENLVVFGRLVGASRSAARARAHELLEEFGLTGAADRPIRQFSGGMRRRLDLAASMITRPRLLFLDEPTTGLDPRTRAQMWNTVRRLVSDGSTVLLTTQYLDEADELADHVAVMDRGKVVADGTTDELKAKVGDTRAVIGIADADRLADAGAVCSAFASAEVIVADPDLRVVVPMPDVDRLPELLLALRERSIAFTAVNVEKPSLDEVFFELTDGGSGTGEAA
ncbi:ATP-binding cassette domain-containing protein [Gordonia pseudamarae]|jgi:ABC-2 type transport system ATP-binding protein|uniref:ATP-binding cassette domain-containing protein n=1 Tax=Gordonia pseudamarae TaxID=2831662 RepID=A0ABX6IE19_9ACTN|nr:MULTISPECIES: ATP-binding cassette domain-containing protein [Gordonia]MBD0021548.1 ATP-binding cassette domain-containing protein [Gordonia sp. (in: high G+C Gram-positive bacteria)]QHN25160.1 ATP-binding cassette domain-containing protein [Gordonia pseudamarae]QHN34092.1 ATP-binding cassette domain-containing protein [Gordonia pseudamarae]